MDFHFKSLLDTGTSLSHQGSRRGAARTVPLKLQILLRQTSPKQLEQLQCFPFKVQKLKPLWVPCAWSLAKAWRVQQNEPNP